MNVEDRSNLTAFYGQLKGIRSLLHLRMVELLAFILIVFIAREIASFRYDTPALILLFALATLLQVGGTVSWQWIGGRLGWSEETCSHRQLWYSGIVDVLVVVGIVYVTGTVESPFLFLLVVPLFFASHVFPRLITAAVYMAGSILCVATLGYLELIGALPHFSCYEFRNDAYQDPNYLIGSLLVLSGFLGLIVFLSGAFQRHFHRSVTILQEKDRETTSKIQQLTRLYDISLGINAVMTVETLLKMVAKEATILLGQPWSSIVLFNREHEITHTALVGIPEAFHARLGTRIRKGGLSELLIKRKKPIVIEDVLAETRAATGEFLIATKIRSLIGLPLSNGREVIGTIYVGDFVPKRFERKHVRLLSIMCDQLAIAIAKSKLYESLQRKISAHERKLETLEKVNQLKSEYVSHVSHELRTPLTSIKAYMETLESHIDDPTFTERKSFLGIVSNETDRLIRIVNDILDVSNMEFGQRPLQRTSFSMSEVIADVVSMLQPKLKTKRIVLNVRAPDNLPKVDADKDLIAQVFVNLITNAVKYSPEDTEITIRGEEKAVDVVFSIEDQGIGIPQAQLERIFERYFRVKSTQSKQYDGVGLGLAIVKNIVEQHGGRINVKSEENVGSVFTFSVPKEHCVNDLLGYIAEGIDAKTELHEMLTLIVRMIAELLSAKIASLMLLDHTQSELFIKVSFGLDEWIVDQARVKVGEGIAGKVAETGEPLLIDNIERNTVHEKPNKDQYETVSLLSVPLKVNDVVVGVVNVNNKTSGEPFNLDDMSLLTSFAERISVSLERFRTARDTQLYLDETIEAFRKMLDTQIRTRTLERTVNLTVKLARQLGLSEKEVKVVQYVASVHDIGMTKVSDDILNKTFHLTPEELEEIKRHPQEGTELIRPLEFVELVSNIILHHHERVDGMGYPLGLKGDDIPIGARVLSIIDAFQSMTSERPYRDAMTVSDALTELVACAGKQFDETIVGAFINVLADEDKISTRQYREFKKSLAGEAKTGVIGGVTS